MWQTITAWLAGNAVRLVWAFLQNLVKRRADDPRLAAFIRDQIVFLQATSPLDGKSKLFAVADAALAYAKNLGSDVAYSTIVTLSAALFDEMAPQLEKTVQAWIDKKTHGLAL